jgi:hypothetical protein
MNSTILYSSVQRSRSIDSYKHVTSTNLGFFVVVEMLLQLDVILFADPSPREMRSARHKYVAYWAWQ